MMSSFQVPWEHSKRARPPSLAPKSLIHPTLLTLTQVLTSSRIGQKKNQLFEKCCTAPSSRGTVRKGQPAYRMACGWTAVQILG